MARSSARGNGSGSLRERSRRIALLVFAVFAVFAVFGVFAGACTSFGSDSPEVAVGNDGGDEGQPDSTSNEAAPDAPTGPDGGFCAQHATSAFCDDFDDDGVVGTRWSARFMDGDAGLAAVTDSFVSSPRSLVARVPSGSGSAYLRKIMSSTGGSHPSFAFSIRVDQTGGPGPAGLASISFGDETLAPRLRLTLSPTDAVIEEAIPPKDGGGQSFSVHALSQGLANKWVKVRIDLAIGPPQATPTVTVSFDGTTVLDKKEIDKTFVAGPPVIELGVLYTSGATMPWSVHFDDVTLD